MPYDFREWDKELEPQAASSRGGIPPLKTVGIGVVDPRVPPKRPPGSVAAVPGSFLVRVLAALLLTGLAIATFVLFFASR